MINVAHEINKVIEQFNPLGIYLFGSYSRGTQTEASDLDLLVIDDRATPMNRAKDLTFEISKALYPRDYHLDLLTYSLQSFNDKIKKNDPLIVQIVNEGKKVYERSRA